MSPERTQHKEFPDRQTWEEKIRMLEERLEGDLTPQQEKRTVEELEALKTARDFGFNAAALEQALDETADTTLEKKLTAALTIIKEAGTVEAARARVIPGPIRSPEETAAIFAIPRLEGREPNAEAAVQEVAEVLKKETRGLNLGREITKKDVAEFLRQLNVKRFLGTTLFEGISGAGVGFLARNIANSIGVLTGGTGYLISVPAGAVAGALAGGVTAWLRERHREVSRDEIVEKARSAEGERKEKFDAYLKLVELKEKNPDSPEITEEQKKFYQELRKEFGVRKKQIFIGAAKGAFFGAVGGTVATWLSNQFGLGGGGRTVENLTEARKAAKAAGGEALRQQIEQAATAASGTEYARAVRAGLAGLDTQDFTALTRKGEGATHLARKLISDYINQHQALGDKAFRFSKAELVYAEDWLQKYQFTNGGVVPRLGEIFKVRGDTISAALAEARDLSPAEIENLNNKWVGKITEKTWKSIFDFKNVYSADNDFATKIFEEAQRKSAAAGKKAAEELGRAVARPPSPAASMAAESWFRATFNKYGPPIIMVGAGAGGVYGLLRTVRRMQDRRAARRTEKEAEEQEAPAGPVADVKEQRRTEEETLRAEAARLEAARTETERVEHEKKLAADPVRQLFKEHGQTIELEDGLVYLAPNKEYLETGSGDYVNFPDYPSYRKHLEGLTPEQRKRAEKAARAIDNKPILGVWMNKSLQDKLEESPELKKKFFEILPKIERGLLEDTYHGLPEKEDPEAAAESLMDELKKKFRDTPFSFYRNLDIPVEEEIEALQKLSRILEKIPAKDLPETGFMFRIGKKGVYSDRLMGRVMEVDPSFSEYDMRLYIMESAKRIKAL